MPDEDKPRCKVEMLNGEPCGREAVDGEKCICHSENPEKDLKAFRRAVQAEVSSGHPKVVDLRDFVFPADEYRQYFNKCTKTIQFIRCHFLGQANFRYTIFGGPVLFTAATFHGRADFNQAEFQKNCDFHGCQFLDAAHFTPIIVRTTVLFHGCNFHSAPNFSQTDLEGGKLVFDGGRFTEYVWPMFPVGADFRRMTLNYPRSLVFRKVALDRCQFLETDVTKIEFVDVEWAVGRDIEDRKAVQDEKDRSHSWQRWSERREETLASEKRRVFNQPVSVDMVHKWWRTFSPVVGRVKKYARQIEWLYKRNRLNRQFHRREPEPNEYEFNLIAQLYRRLQRNYIDSYQYRDAGDFYIGEQEMIRKSKGSLLKQLRTTNLWYWLFARYGQHWLQPLRTGVLPLLALSPLFLMLGDIQVPKGVARISDRATINYDLTWHWDPGSTLIFLKDLFVVALANLKLVATGVLSTLPDYLSIWQCLLIIGERLLLLVFISFFVLALTRQFKRKSF